MNPNEDKEYPGLSGYNSLWEVSQTAPSGIEFTNPKLAAALQQGKTEFTKEDLDSFDMSDLSTDCYIRAGDKFFKPVRGSSSAQGKFQKDGKIIGKK